MCISDFTSFQVPFCGVPSSGTHATVRFLSENCSTQTDFWVSCAILRSNSLHNAVPYTVSKGAFGVFDVLVAIPRIHLMFVS